MAPPTPLQRAIFESGRSQRSIAEAVGLTEARFSLIVNGLHPGDDVARKTSDELASEPSVLWPHLYGGLDVAA